MINNHEDGLNIGIFSFFAGAGFLDLGFEQTAGYETLFVNEYHKPFLDIYKSTREDLGISTPEFGYCLNSITDFLDPYHQQFLQDSIKVAKHKKDLIGFIGGPPCPDFSVGGKNKGAKGENGKLSATYVQLITQNQPDFFLFENVKGLYRTKKHRAFFESIKKQLIESGYYLTEKLVNAIEYGAPQDRERIILIGFKRNVLVDFGFYVNGSPKLKEFNWKEKTIYSQEKLMQLNWPKQEKFFENNQKKCPENIIKELTVNYWFRKNNVENHPNANHHFQPRAGLPKFQTIDEGDDLKKSYKRLHRWRYSPTAAYGNNEVHLHPFKARRISAAEALAIQSLPKNFVIPEYISLSNMFKTIGNGVPYLAAKGLAETILSFIEKTNVNQPAHEEIICK